MSNLGHVYKFDFTTMTKQVYPVVYVNNHYVYYKEDRTGASPLVWITNPYHNKPRGVYTAESWNEVYSNNEIYEGLTGVRMVYAPKGVQLTTLKFDTDTRDLRVARITRGINALIQRYENILKEYDLDMRYVSEALAKECQEYQQITGMRFTYKGKDILQEYTYKDPKSFSNPNTAEE